MKQIKIMRLALENFKCHKNLVLNFMGNNTSIYGDNAAGKTSVYDALTWLLFGKDSAGNTTAEVKPLNSSGEVADHLAVTAVSADLEVDGRIRNLRRTYRERWVTRRGSTETVYDGNTSEYYVDGVPKQKNGFMEAVSQIVDEDAFKMLTSVSRFADGISWQERRNVLFDIAGTADDRQILATDERFAPVLEGMEDLSITDYKKKLQARRRDLMGARSDIPARISECEKTVQDISAIDFASAEAELSEQRLQKERLAQELLAIQNSTAVQAKQNELNEARVELRELNARNEAFRASQPDAQAQVYGLKSELDGLTLAMAEKQRTMDFIRTDTIGEIDRKVEQYRQEWIRENGTQYDGSMVCPTCGQDLPADRIRLAVEKFEKDKQKNLKKIQERAGESKAAREKAELRIRQIGQEMDSLQAEINGKKAQLDAAIAGAAPVVDMDGYSDSVTAANQKIAALNEELASLTLDADGKARTIQQEIESIGETVAGLERICSKQDLLEYTRKRMEQLREDADSTSAALDSVEGMLFLLDDYSRYKTQFVEESINSLFELARFRLFREQANGGIEDRCDVVYNGVPYSGLNTGMKINIGIDIIRTLSRHYGVSVPLFIDNAESVTKLETPASQVIRLVVSENDKELRVHAD